MRLWSVVGISSHRPQNGELDWMLSIWYWQSWTFTVFKASPLLKMDVGSGISLINGGWMWKAAAATWRPRMFQSKFDLHQLIRWKGFWRALCTKHCLLITLFSHCHCFLNRVRPLTKYRSFSPLVAASLSHTFTFALISRKPYGGELHVPTY